jgi:hypothetical protein
MRIFKLGDQKVAPSFPWARKIGKAVARLFSDDAPQPVNDLAKTDSAVSSYDDMTNMTMMPHMWRVYEDRKSLWRDMNRMDSEDELVNKALDTIADFAVNFENSEEVAETSFRVKAKSKKVQDILDNLIARLDLQNDLWQIAREMVKTGNYLPEVLVDRKRNQIVRLKPTIPYMIWPKTSELGDKVPGWVNVPDAAIYNGKGQELEEWQICPFIFGAKKGYLATPMLAAARRNWIRLAKVEDGMGVARLVRAYDKLVHRIPVKKEWTQEQVMATIKRYKDAITRRKLVTSEGALTQSDTPLDVQTDFFLPDIGDGTGGITAITGTNLQLGNLNDVYYHREKLIARLSVPLAYLQITSAEKTHLKAGSSVSSIDIAFAAFMRRVHASLRSGLVRLFQLELVLQGQVPTPDAFVLELATPSTKDPLEESKISLTNAEAATYFIEAFGALPPELIASKYLDLTPKEQAMLDGFLASDGKNLMKTKIKTLELGAKPAPAPQLPAGGPGNNNKSKVARSKEQKPAAKQEDGTLYDIDSLVHLFMSMNQKVNEALQEAGLDIPDDVGLSERAIRQGLEGLALTS